MDRRGALNFTEDGAGAARSEGESSALKVMEDEGYRTRLVLSGSTPTA